MLNQSERHHWSMCQFQWNHSPSPPLPSLPDGAYPPSHVALLDPHLARIFWNSYNRLPQVKTELTIAWKTSNSVVKSLLHHFLWVSLCDCSVRLGNTSYPLCISFRAPPSSNIFQIPPNSVMKESVHSGRKWCFKTLKQWYLFFPSFLPTNSKKFG